MVDQPLNGRVAIVTGASHGTGVDIARAFAAAGAHVAVHYRSDRAAAEGVASSIRESGGVADVFAADVARMDDVRRLVADVRAALGAPSIVVNNAGPVQRSAIHRACRGGLGLRDEREPQVGVPRSRSSPRPTCGPRGGGAS